MTQSIGAGEPATDETEFAVRLVMTVNAGSREEAVVKFVNELVEKGLRGWVYATLDPETGETTGNYDGWGTDVSDRMAAIRRQVESALPDIETEPEHIPASEPDDDELIDLAERLNAGEQ